MTTLFKVLLFAGIFFLAIACGGGSSTYEDNSNRTETGIRTVNIKGSIDDPTSPAKPRWSAGNSLVYTGIVSDLNNTAQKWPMQIDDSENYTTEIVRRSNVVLEVKRNGVFAFSRVLHEEETLINLQQAKINTLSHLQASMARSLLQSVGGDLKTHMATVNQSLFGKAVLNESDYSLKRNTLAESQTDIKAMVLTYDQLFKTPSSPGVLSLVPKLNQALANPSPEKAIAGWLNVINGLSDPSEIDIYASAHEGAKNSRVSGANLIFSSLYGKISSSLLRSAIDDAMASPVFGANIDTVRKATIGALFQYTFPRATTEDILGIASYQGNWQGGTPLGTWRASADEGRTLQFLPDSADIGKSFTFGLTVEGGNGKEASATNIQVDVRSPSLTPMPRKILANRPLLGPVVDREFLYLVSAVSIVSPSGNVDKFYLQKYHQSDIQNTGEDILIPYFIWALPTTEVVTDLKLHLNTLYISTETAAYGFNAAFQGNLTVNPPQPTHLNESLPSTRQVIVGDEIIHFHSSGNVQRTNLSLGDNTILSAPTAFFTSMGNRTILSGNSSIYDYNHNLLFAAGSQQHNAYFFNSSGNLEKLSSFAPNALAPVSDSAPLPGLPMTFVQASDNLVTQWLPGEYSIESLSISGNHHTEKSLPHAVNGNILLGFLTDVTSGANQAPTYTLQGNSLSDNALFFTENSEIPLYDLYLGDNPDGLTMKVQNPSQGVDTGKCGSWIYSIGKDGIGSANWFIQAHLLAPAD